MGVFGIVGANAGDNQFGRFAVKQQNHWAVDFHPMVAGTAISRILTEDVRRSLRTTVKSCSAPQISFEEIEVVHGNEKFGAAGRADWRANALSMSFDDAISSPFGGDGDDNSTLISPATIFYEIAALQQSPITAAGAYPRDYKMNIILQIFGPDAVEIERFIFHGAWLTSYSTADLSYDGSDKREVTAEFKYDYWWRIRPGEVTQPSELVGIDYDKQGG